MNVPARSVVSAGATNYLQLVEAQGFAPLWKIERLVSKQLCRSIAIRLEEKPYRMNALSSMRYATRPDKLWKNSR